MTWRGFWLRVASLPLIFVLASAISYTLIWGPWNDAQQNILDGAPADIREEYERCLRFDQSLAGGYADWLRDAATGDFGRSLVTDRSVADGMWDRLPPTAQLVGLSVFFAVAFSRALRALRERLGIRRSVIAFWAAIASIPLIVSLPLLIILPSRWWGYAVPIDGFVPFYQDPWDQFRLFVPPAIAIGASCAVLLPASRKRVHSPRMAPLQDIVATATRALPLALVGAIIAEWAFSTNGDGSWFLQAALRGDRPMIQALLSFALFVALSFSLFTPYWWLPARGVSNASRAHGRLLRDPLVVVPAGILAAFVVIAIVAPIIVPDPVGNLSFDDRFAGPSFDHPFGADHLGRDMVFRVIAGISESMRFAAPAVSAVAVGAFIALLIAYVARARPAITNLVGDIASRWEAAPLLWVVIAVASVNSLGEQTVPMAVVAVVGFVAGLALCGVFAHAASANASEPPKRNAGSAQFVPFARRVLRERASLVVARACRVAALAILAEATLSYLGLGALKIDGNLGSDMHQDIGLANPHVFAFPAAALFLMLFALNFLAATFTERGSVAAHAADSAAAPVDPAPSTPLAPDS